MKRLFMILILAISFIVINPFMYSNVYADSDSMSLQDAIDGAKKFVEEGEKNSADTIDQGKLKVASDTVYNILLAAGFFIAVAVGVILGIQFMMAGVDEQAGIKEKLIAYVIGCIIIFGAFGIWKIFVELGQKI